MFWILFVFLMGMASFCIIVVSAIEHIEKSKNKKKPMVIIGFSLFLLLFMLEKIITFITVFSTFDWSIFNEYVQRLAN